MLLVIFVPIFTVASKRGSQRLQHSRQNTPPPPLPVRSVVPGGCARFMSQVLHSSSKMEQAHESDEMTAQQWHARVAIALVEPSDEMEQATPSNDNDDAKSSGEDPSEVTVAPAVATKDQDEGTSNSSRLRPLYSSFYSVKPESSSNDDVLSKTEGGGVPVPEQRPAPKLPSTGKEQTDHSASLSEHPGDGDASPGRIGWTIEARPPPLYSSFLSILSPSSSLVEPASKDADPVSESGKCAIQSHSVEEHLEHEQQHDGDTKIGGT